MMIFVSLMRRNSCDDICAINEKGTFVMIFVSLMRRNCCEYVCAINERELL